MEPRRGLDPGRGGEHRSQALVAEGLARGRTNPEVAAELLITVATVKTHVTRIFAKLNVRNRAELANAMHQEK